MKETLLKKLADVNRELWLLLSLFGIAALINFLISSHSVMLNFYVLPTIFSAYFYGRRHAISTAIASVLLIVLLAYLNTNLFSAAAFTLEGERWFSVIAWGGSLVLTAVAMGTLYEKDKTKLRELRETYHGVLLILTAVHCQGSIHAEPFLPGFHICHADRQRNGIRRGTH